MRIAPRPRRGPGTVRRCHRQGTRGFRPDVQPLEDRQLLSGADPFQPSPYEQYMLELINWARANPAAEGQKLRTLAQTDSYIQQVVVNAGLNLNQFSQVISSYGPEAPLAFNTRLIEAARDQSLTMLAANNQVHSPADYLTNPASGRASDGRAFYPAGQGAWSTGENIFAYSQSIGGTDPIPYVDYFNEAFFLDWGNPDFGHLRNLLSPGFSEVGIGLLHGVTPRVPPGAGNPTPANQGMNVGPDIVTQEFGSRQGQVFLTGSFYVDRDKNQFYTPGEGLGSVTVTAVGRNGQGVFQTQTWNSGGYSLPLPPGTYVVTARGNLPSAQSTVVTIGGSNVLWEVGFPAQSQVQAQSQSNADRPVPGDYLGNGTTDLAVYRSSTAQWFLGGQSQPVSFGAPNLDVPVPGDYLGNGHTGIAVYRPTTGQWFLAGQGQPVSFGAANLDIPVPGDYDGLGRTQIAAYRPTTGQWFIAGHAQPVIFGSSHGDIPVPGDYDGTGHMQIAVYRPTTGQWFIAGHAQPVSFGAANLDIPVPGDYLGNGHTGLAVYRPTTGQWFLAGQSQPVQLGTPGLDIPIRGDFDGDGSTDPAVYRSSTAQWLYQDSQARTQAVQFGSPGTLPPASSWLGGASLSPRSPIAAFAVSAARSSAGLGSGQALSSAVSLLDAASGRDRSRPAHAGHEARRHAPGRRAPVQDHAQGWPDDRPLRRP